LLNHSLNFSYVHEASDGIEAETEFIYDLELPADFLPNPLDGEVSEYHLWDMEKVNGLSFHEIIINVLPCEQVKSEMAAEHFKPNCALVILKFMIRKGLIDPDTGTCTIRLKDKIVYGRVLLFLLRTSL